jgi:hypothetical protein
MPRDLSKILIYHITDVTNLAGILAAGGLHSDVALAKAGGPSMKIGYDHIKLRRMQEYRVACAGNRFVGEFVPFYYCPRSPMLYTINLGNTGRPAGCQNTIVHLVSNVQTAIDLGKPWALSDSNAGSSYADFFDDVAMLDSLDWDSINSNQWRGKMPQKMAEFLVADFFPWTAIQGIGCHNSKLVEQLGKLLNNSPHRPQIAARPGWYY